MRLQRRIRKSFLERLEQRDMFCSNPTLLQPDTIEVQQNAFESSLLVLANDPLLSSEDTIAGINYDRSNYRGHDVRVADDGRSIVYTPAPYFAGEFKLNYRVDREYACQGEVTVNVVSPLQDDTFALAPDRDTYVLDVLDNDSFSQFGIPARIDDAFMPVRRHGVEVSEDGQHLLFHRHPDFYGEETIHYVTDGINFGATVTVNIVSPIEADRLQVTYGQEPATIDVISNDPFWEDYQGRRRITELLEVPDGSVVEVVDGGKAIRFTQNGIAVGPQRIKYTIDNEITATLSVYVVAVAQNDTFTIAPNSGQHRFDILKNDGDSFFNPTTRAESITRVSDTEAGGEVSIQFSRVLYTPPTNFVGTDRFTYVADGIHEAAVTVKVDRYDNETRSDQFTIQEGTANNVLAVLDNDFRRSSYPGSRIITSVAEPDGASVTISDDGQSLIFTATQTERRYEFTYTVDHVFTERVSVQTEYVAGLDSFTIGSATEYSLPVIDQLVEFPPGYQGDRKLTYVDDRGGSNEGACENAVSCGIVWLGQWIVLATEQDSAIPTDIDDGMASISEDGKSIVYVPRHRGEDAVIRYVVDDQFEGMIVAGVPVRLAFDEATIFQGQSVEIDPLANDYFAGATDFATIFSTADEYDGNRIITSVVRTSGDGQMTIAVDGKTVTYEPGGFFSGLATFEYQVDGSGNGKIEVLVLPVLREDHFRIDIQDPSSNANGEVLLDVLANDRLAGDIPKEITAVTDGAKGTTRIDPSGRFVIYQPRPATMGLDSFTYQVAGGLHGKVTLDVGATAIVHEQFAADSDFTQAILQPGNSDYSVTKRLPSLLPDRVTHTQHPATGDHYDFVGSSVVITSDFAEPDVLSQTSFKGNAVSLHLHDDRLAVVSNGRHRNPVVPSSDFYLNAHAESDRTTYVSVFDVTNPSRPKLVQRTDMDGSYIDSWIDNDGTLRLLLVDASLYSKNVERISTDGEFAGFESEGEREARFTSQVGRVVQDSMPQFASFNASGQFVRGGLLVEPTEVIQSESETAYQLISAVAIDMQNSEPGMKAAAGILVDGSSRVYRGAAHFYILEQVGVSGDLLTSSQYRDTRITMFGVDGETIERQSHGIVPGVWSDGTFYEHDGRLHFVTNVTLPSPPNAVLPSSFGNWFGERPPVFEYENMFQIVENDNGVMKTVGSVSGIGLGGRFYGSLQYYDGGVRLPINERNLQYQVIDFTDPTSPSTQDVQLPDATRQWPPSNSFSSPSVGSIDGHRIVVRERSSSGNQFKVNNVRVIDLSNPTNPVVEFEEEYLGYSPNEELQARLDALGATNIWASEFDQLRSFSLAQLQSSGVIHRGEAVADQELPNLDTLHRLQSQAIAQLAFEQAIDEDDISLLATEASDGATSFLLRANEAVYAYRSTGRNDVVAIDWQSPTSGPLQWHNAANRHDVNRDGIVSPIDVLLTIQKLNAGLRGRLPSSTVARQIQSHAGLMVDVSDDGFITPVDVLFIIQHLNSRSVSQRASASSEPTRDVGDGSAEPDSELWSSVALLMESSRDDDGHRQDGW